MAITNITPRVSAATVPLQNANNISIHLRQSDTIRLEMTCDPPSAADHTTWYLVHGSDQHGDNNLDSTSSLTIAELSEIGRGAACNFGALTTSNPHGSVLSGTNVDDVNHPPWRIISNPDSALPSPENTSNFDQLYPQILDDPRLTSNNPCDSVFLNVTLTGDTIVPIIGYAIDTPDHQFQSGTFKFAAVATPADAVDQFLLKPPLPAPTGADMSFAIEPYSPSMSADYVNNIEWWVNDVHVVSNDNQLTYTSTNIQSDQHVTVSGYNCDINNPTFVYQTVGLNVDLLEAAEWDEQNGVGFLADPEKDYGAGGEISIGVGNQKKRTSINAFYDSMLDDRREPNKPNTKFSELYDGLVNNSNVTMPNDGGYRFSSFNQAQCVSFYWVGTSETRGSWGGDYGTYDGNKTDGSITVWLNANSFQPDANGDKEARVEIKRYQRKERYKSYVGIDAPDQTPVLLGSYGPETVSFGTKEESKVEFTGVDTHLHQQKSVNSQGTFPSRMYDALPLFLQIEVTDMVSGMTRVVDIEEEDLDAHGTEMQGSGYAFGDFVD